jgi:hypothetical protein
VHYPGNAPPSREDSKPVQSDLREKLSQAAETLEQGVASLKEKFGLAGNGQENEHRPGAMSARAEWEATRSDEQKEAERNTRTSQLTDEAHGDEPQDATQRKDKSITPDEFYTKY